MVGRARTMRLVPHRPDLAALFPTRDENPHRKAVEQIGAGEVLVIDAHGNDEGGILGDIMSARLKARGAGGLVVDGSLRDVWQIKGLDLPVYVRHVNAAAVQRGLSAVEMDGYRLRGGGGQAGGLRDRRSGRRGDLPPRWRRRRRRTARSTRTWRSTCEKGERRGPASRGYPPNEAVRAEYEARRRGGLAGVGRGVHGRRTGAGREALEHAERGRGRARTTSSCTSARTARSCAAAGRSSSAPSWRPTRVRSSLHPGAGQSARTPAPSSTPSSACRPPCSRCARVLLGQEGERFRALLGPGVTDWQRLEAPARRRQWRWDGAETMTVHVASSVRPRRRHPLPGGLPDRVEQAAPAAGGPRQGPEREGWTARLPPAPEALATLGERLGVSRTTGSGSRPSGATPSGSVCASARGPEGPGGAPARRARRGLHPAGAPLVAADRRRPRRARAGRAPALLRLLQHARGGEPGLRLRPAPGADALGVPGEHAGGGGAGGARGAARRCAQAERRERALLRLPAVAPLPP